jgi:hypothetical protein
VELAELGVAGIDVRPTPAMDRGLVTVRRQDGRTIALVVALDLAQFPNLLPAVAAPAGLLDAIRAVTGDGNVPVHETSVEDLTAMIEAYFAHDRDARVRYLAESVERMAHAWVRAAGSRLYTDGVAGGRYAVDHGPDAPGSRSVHRLTLVDAVGRPLGVVEVRHPAPGHVPADFDGALTIRCTIAGRSPLDWVAGRMLAWKRPEDTFANHADRLLRLVHARARVAASIGVTEPAAPVPRSRRGPRSPG